VRRWLLTVALAGALIVPAGPASGYQTPGPRWPGDTIRYHDTLPKSWNWTIRKAVRTWNTSGARIRFRKVERGRAQVLIGYGDLGNAAGLATIGQRPGAFVKVNRLMFKPLRPGLRVFAAQVLAHEFGHVLGLGHVQSNNCRLMSTPLLTYCPKPPESWLYDCAWLAKDDRRGAVHLYGGSPRQPRHQYCLREPKPPQLLDVRFRSGDPVRITWRVPAGLRPGGYVTIEVYEQSRCEGDVAAPLLSSARVRAVRSRWQGSHPGLVPNCYQVQVHNRYGLGADPVLGLATGPVPG